MSVKKNVRVHIDYSYKKPDFVIPQLTKLLKVSKKYSKNELIPIIIRKTEKRYTKCFNLCYARIVYDNEEQISTFTCSLFYI
jgi:hypothetical protein